MENKIHIYYDGVCNLCSSSIGRVASSSKGGLFQATDVTKGTLPKGVDMESAMRDMHVEADGTLYRGADAVLRIMREYPLLRPFAALGSLPGIHLVARGAYRLLANSRYRIFGKKEVS